MAYHGKGGNFSYGTAVNNIQNWTLSPSGDTAEVTSMGDDWAKRLAGLTDFSGSCEAKSKKAFDTVTALGTSGTGLFTLEATGPSLSAGCIVTSISETVSYDAEGTLSFQIQGNSAAGLVYSATGGVAPTGETDAFHGKHLRAEYDVTVDAVDPVSFTDPREWTVSLECATAESTAAHATNKGRTRLAGVKSGTATLICVASGDREVEEGDSLENLLFYRTGTDADGFYEGAVVCTGAEFGVDRDGVAIITYAFDFTGAVSHSIS